MADDQPFYAPNLKPLPPRQPQPRTPVWTLEHRERGRVQCALLSLGESWGWSAELYAMDGSTAADGFSSTPTHYDGPNRNDKR